LDLLDSQLSAILKVKPELRITSLLIGYQSVFSVIFLSGIVALIDGLIDWLTLSETKLKVVLLDD
jgi:hypothetical protein